MKKFVSVGILLSLCVAASAITIDGDISDWVAAGKIITDPSDDRMHNTDNGDSANSMEMTRWGACSDGTYIYWFAEIGNGYTWADFQDPSDKDHFQMYPGLWIDVDASTSTHLCDASETLPNNCADYGKAEWAENHRGIDLNIEWGTDKDGTVNYWGSTKPVEDPEDPDIPGDVGTVILGGADAQVSIVGSIIEMAVKIDDLNSNNDIADAIAQTGVDPTTLGDYWMVAVGVQGLKQVYDEETDKWSSEVRWGYDVGTPIPLAKDGSDVLVGDANLDGSVGLADLTVLGANWGNTDSVTWQNADFNGDGSVGLADLTELGGNWGATASGEPVNPSQTPEPATMSLLGIGVFALLRRKK